MENALGEALKETEKVYGMDGVFTEELREMERKRNLNQSMETLWADLGNEAVWRISKISGRSFRWPVVPEEI